MGGNRRSTTAEETMPLFARSRHWLGPAVLEASGIRLRCNHRSRSLIPSILPFLPVSFFSPKRKRLAYTDLHRLTGSRCKVFYATGEVIWGVYHGKAAIFVLTVSHHSTAAPPRSAGRQPKNGGVEASPLSNNRNTHLGGMRVRHANCYAGALHLHRFHVNGAVFCTLPS
ncbi:hypothetical protein MRX96_056384 [Rhipicephalus microplus]